MKKLNTAKAKKSDRSGESIPTAPPSITVESFNRMELRLNELEKKLDSEKDLSARMMLEYAKILEDTKRLATSFPEMPTYLKAFHDNVGAQIAVTLSNEQLVYETAKLAVDAIINDRIDGASLMKWLSNQAVSKFEKRINSELRSQIDDSQILDEVREAIQAARKHIVQERVAEMLNESSVLK